MEHAQDTPTGRHRLIAGAAVAAVSVAAALAFGRVFRGPATTWKLALAAAVAVALAVALERRSLVLATLASAAILLVAVGVLLFPGTTLYGLPTLDMLGAIGEALARVGREARVQVAPTPPLTPLFLAALTAVWTASFSAHALATRAGSPLLALLPLTALLTFSDAVLEPEPRPGYGAIFLLGALAVLFVDGLRRVERWGPLWPWRRGRRLTATTTRGARRVALVVVLVAFLFPGILPGYGDVAVIDVSSAGGGAVDIDPLVSIKSSLERRDPLELFRVQADAPSYWRMLALDRFDGETWTSTDRFAQTRGVAISAGEPIHEGLIGDTLDQRFTISRDLRFRWIPVAFPAHSIDVGRPFRFDPVLSTAVVETNLRKGDTYSAISGLSAPSARELRAIDFEGQSGPADAFYLELPGGFPTVVRDMARRWSDRETTDFDRILAVQERLLRDFSYSLDVAPRANTDALVDFLTRSKRGFCQQFATTMAAMLRSLGYPARVAVGFRPGMQDQETGEWIVTTSDAHSWVEVLFPQHGWIAFEPTPGRENPVAQRYLDPASYRCTQDPAACPGAGGEGEEGGAAVSPRDRRQLREGRPLRGGGRFPGRELAPEPDRGLPLSLLLQLGAAIAILLIVTVPPAKVLRRRWRLARARRPGEAAVAAYEVFVDRAADLGYPRGRGETPSEYVARLSATGAIPPTRLEPLASAAIQAVYGTAEPSRERVRTAGAAGRSAIRDLRHRTPLVRQVRGLYRVRRAA